MSPKVPTELADARIAANIAWNEYDAIDSASPFKQQAWNVVNWLEERASKMYADWQKVGGTSDIDSIVAAEIANDDKWLDSTFETITKENENKQAKSFIELMQAHQARAKATVWVKPENCQHEKAYAIHSGMYCNECREIFPPRNDFEKQLVGSKNPRTNGYVNWKMK